MFEVINTDCLEGLRGLASESVQCCVTSPPYFGLRDYGHDGQIGLEATPGEFVSRIVGVFQEVRRVLADDGTLWLNLGDSYSAGSNSPTSFRRDRAEVIPSSRKRTGKDKDPKRLAAASSAIIHGARGIGPKQLMGIPWRVAFALQDAGWFLRQDIIWHKPNAMPESVKDRCTKAHEYLFLLTKSPRYYFDSEAIKEPAVSERPAGNKTHKYVDAYESGPGEEHRTKAGLMALSGVEWETRNRRSVWTIPTKKFSGAHFATFPPELVEPCILAGSREGDTILDPFTGSGTTGVVAIANARKFVGCELNPEYAAMARNRIGRTQPALI